MMTMMTKEAILTVSTQVFVRTTLNLEKISYSEIKVPNGKNIREETLSLLLNVCINFTVAIYAHFENEHRV